jgi:transposase
MAIAKLALWFNRVTDSECKSFNSISTTMYAHYDKILNYFNYRSTNASAESFNAKIKAFRSNTNWRKRCKLFLFRLAKIYACNILLHLKYHLIQKKGRWHNL